MKSTLEPGLEIVNKLEEQVKKLQDAALKYPDGSKERVNLTRTLISAQKALDAWIDNLKSRKDKTLYNLYLAQNKKQVH